MNSTEPQTDDLPDDATEEASADASTETTEAADQEKPKLKLEVKIDQPSACQRHVAVTISRDDLNRYLDDAYTELMPKAEVPGFRSGRAPRKLVESKFRDQIADQVKGTLLMDCMGQVSDENEFSAISEPEFDFDAVEVPREGPMTFEFDVEVRPDFDVPEWKGMSIERPVRKFTKKDVDAHMKNLLGRYAQLVPCQDKAKADDHVTVDVTFSHEGKVISSVEDLSLRIRPILSFPDGKLEDFDKLMVGVAEGETKETQITLSDDGPNESLRGKEVSISFKVTEVKTLELPKIDEAFLETIGGFESEEKLREAVESEMERQLVYHQQRSVRQQIASKLTESADWDLPPEMLRRQSHRELERAVMELQSSGFSNDDIQAHENDLRRNSLASTSTALKEHFILERIAEEEKFDVEPDDFEDEIAMIALQGNESPRRVRARFEKRGMMDTLRNQIIERKVIELITSQAEFKEVKYKPDPDETTAVDHCIGGEVQEIPEAKHGGQAEELKKPVDHS